MIKMDEKTKRMARIRKRVYEKDKKDGIRW